MAISIGTWPKTTRLAATAGNLTCAQFQLCEGGHADSSRSRTLCRIFFPFALAYFLSYLLRNINGVVAPSLAFDFHLDAGQLGFLTAAYFLDFAAMQVPIGACLDRFGPVMVQVPLYILAAFGAATFSFAQSPWQLAAGRLLIGVGVAAGLVAGLKTIALWFPKERVPLLNGVFIAFGTLGAVAATAPTGVGSSPLLIGGVSS